MIKELFAIIVIVVCILFVSIMENELFRLDERKIAFQGYPFNNPYPKKNGLTSWPCASQCGLRINTTSNGDKLQFHSIASKQQTHNFIDTHHTKVDQQYVDKQTFKTALTQTIEESKGNETGPEYYEKIRREHPSLVANVGSLNTTKNHIYKIKNKYGPPRPPSLFDIDDAMHAHPEYAQNFWGYQLRVNRQNLTDQQIRSYEKLADLSYLGSNDEYCLFAGSKQHIQCFHDAPWHVFDGSFKSTAKFSLCGVYYGQTFYLLAIYPADAPNKTPFTMTCGAIMMREIKPDHSAYERALDAFNDACIDEYGIGIFHDREVNVMTDMEEAIRIAVKSKWIQCILHICFFHYAQRIFVNLGKKHLLPVYKESGEHADFDFYCFVRCYITLALLPPVLIPRAWNLLH